MSRNTQMQKTGKLTEELRNAFATPFPIRGWEFAFDLTPAPEEVKFKLYERPPKIVEGELQQPEPPFLVLLAAHMKVTATQKIAPKMQFLGRLFDFAPSVVEAQFVRIVIDQLGLTILFDPKKAPQVMKEDIWAPDREAFVKTAEELVTKHRAACVDTDVLQARKYQMQMGQLYAIRENYLSRVRKLLGEMVQLITAATPDYWDLIEQVMTLKMEPGEVVKLARGAILIEQSKPFIPAEVAMTPVPS